MQVEKPIIGASTSRVQTGHDQSVRIDYVMASGRHKYECTPSGTGCRKWMSDTLSLLGDGGQFLWSEDARHARANIERLWPDNTPLELGGGECYTDDSISDNA
jgi:hypothetical protein